MSHFKLVSSTKTADVIPVEKYISEKTGITVIIAGVEGPLVNGFFGVATEAHDDDGLPHTLEHLIFLGSERYPYKGILDLVANRCMAQGTNAWTDVDHTCYTVYTAGDKGMLSLIPIYLDHILRPTLTDEGFLTEIHHINGEGEDAGVVYCEMQGRENSADSRCVLRLSRAMYPCSGYSAETGGIMENLRSSTNNTKVRNFHKKFYRPENLTIILAGMIEPQDVFKALEVVEEDIIKRAESEPQEEWVKPWQNIPRRPLYGEYKVQWPSDTEDNGQIFFAWRGPVLKEPGSLRDLTGCAILLRYLCETATSPLQRILVEREDALAGDISYNLAENIASQIKIELNNVPLDKLTMARDVALKCLRDVANGVDPFDLERMRRIIRKQLRESIAALESNPHHAVAFRCLADALYSQNTEDFVTRLNPQVDLRIMLEESQSFWLTLMKKYFTKDVVLILGSPSIELQAKMANEEKKRLEQQRKSLGAAGLAEKARKLEAALKFNERPPPSEALAAVPVPPCDSLKSHRITTFSTDGKNNPDFNLKDIPMYARVHSLKTSFVYINMIFDLTSVDQATRVWLPLHLNALGECEIRRGDTLIDYEEVVSTTEQLTVTFTYSIGFERNGNFCVGLFGNFVNISVMCEPKSYEDVVNHIYEVLYCAELSKERLVVFAQRLINEVSNARRTGDRMMYDTLRDTVYCHDSNVHWCTVLRQQKFLKELIEQLTDEGDTAEEALNEAKRTFANITKSFWLHLATDFSRFKLSTKPWKKFAKKNQATKKPPKRYWDYELHEKFGGGFVVGVGGWESCCLAHMAPGPRGVEPRDVAPLAIALNYFTQLEGPMWRLIRGCGLTYGYAIRLSHSEGKLIFSLYRASNPVQAYIKTKAILDEYLADPKFDPDLYESAKSTAMFEVIENEQSPAEVVKRSLLNYMLRQNTSYNKELVSAMSRTSAAQAHAAAARWLPALLHARRSTLAVACHPAKVHDINDAFANVNIKLDAFESMEASHFNK